ncbi:heterokaryon incompatibility protein-domain-containing protein [Xylariales sp. PMI_506]|nr:heterokaryon incompatibility protein-domain-containing protein [Xylariales sp. PMI_506]
MRLIDVYSRKVHEFLPESIPAYAILSHNWGDEEVSFQDMKDPALACLLKGFTKIKYACRQARLDGYSWIWVDTCCIDKTSSAELSEAINSMFRWYLLSEVCYAYLVDMKSLEAFNDRMARGWGPRWFARCWTLQELVDPPDVQFYTETWTPIGSRSDHRILISNLTHISQAVLAKSVSLRDVPVATKSSTRKEDEAYCLLGLFDLNMPLLYGEGKKAFQRLQEEILKNIDDQTIFFVECK